MSVDGINVILKPVLQALKTDWTTHITSCRNVVSIELTASLLVFGQYCRLFGESKIFYGLVKYR